MDPLGLTQVPVAQVAQVAKVASDQISQRIRLTQRTLGQASTMPCHPHAHPHSCGSDGSSGVGGSGGGSGGCEASAV